MVALGHADGMVTGVTRNFDQVLEEVLHVIDPAPDGRVIGMSVVLAKGRTLFIADTNVTEMPEAEELVEIAIEAARAVQTLGYTPRVAFMSYSTFGNPMGERSERVRAGGGHAGRDGRHRLRVRGRDAAGAGAGPGARAATIRSCA